MPGSARLNPDPPSRQRLRPERGAESPRESASGVALARIYEPAKPTELSVRQAVRLTYGRLAIPAPVPGSSRTSIPRRRRDS